jgi:2-polyprenyl-3-methyl-5-hydroxy-6-metoxy-1,4-benzoquinol methylase
LRIADLSQHQSRFDVLLCLEVLEHVLDPLEGLSVAAATLRKGGRAIISVPNAFTAVNRARMLIGRLPASGAGPPGVRGRTYLAPHIRFFDAASFVDLCTRAGLQVVALQGHGTDAWRFSRAPTSLRPLNQRKRGSLLAHTLVVQARRSN